MCGAEGWEDLEDFGKAKCEWLKSFLELKNGIPSADTFRRVMSMLNPKAFQACFCSWIEAAFGSMEPGNVAIDGKVIKASKGKWESPIEVVSAWMQGKHNLCLGQVSLDTAHFNEITAIPELLKMLELEGCLVTIDAIGCQTDILKQIVDENKADYLVCLKGNQPKLHQAVSEFFAEHAKELEIPLLQYESDDEQHGRVEHRSYALCYDVDWIGDAICSDIEGAKTTDKWPGLVGIGMAESHREIGGKTSVEQRLYITSREMSAQEFAQAVRGHWGIENQLHWVLDVTWAEDKCRIANQTAAENLALIRKLSINMFQKIKGKKDTFRRMRKRCGWDNTYLLKALLVGI